LWVFVSVDGDVEGDGYSPLGDFELEPEGGGDDGNNATGGDRHNCAEQTGKTGDEDGYDEDGKTGTCGFEDNGDGDGVGVGNDDDAEEDRNSGDLGDRDRASRAFQARKTSMTELA
jgi:hypothetical protein